MSNCKIVVKNLETNKAEKVKDPYIVVKFKGTFISNFFKF